MLGFGEAKLGAKSGRLGLKKERRAAWDRNIVGMGEDTYITDWRQVRDLRAGIRQRGNVETGEARGKDETLPVASHVSVVSGFQAAYFIDWSRE